MSNKDNPDNKFEIQENESLEDEYEKIKKLSEKYRKYRELLISPLNKIEKIPFINQFLNYETIAKKIGDSYIKKLPDHSKNFTVENNIGVNVDFYGQTINYKTPVSLASFESDLDIIDVWTLMGANPTIKTAMLNSRPGNKPIRLADLKKAQDTIEFPDHFDEQYKTHGMINAMGLPGIPAHEIREKLIDSKFWENKNNRTTLSIGGETIPEYLEVFKTMYFENYYSPFAENITNRDEITTPWLKNAPYINFVDFEINVSCPNTGTGTAACDKSPDGEYKNFEELLSGIKEVTGKDSPLVYIKLSPDFKDEKILELVGIIQKYQMGVVLGNTQSAIKSELSTKTGGLSGPGLNKRMLELVNLVNTNYKNIPIKACGGISTAHDVLEALNAGADTVQMAYGIIEDPYSAISMTNLELSNFCKENDYKSLDAFKNATNNERTNAINSYTFRQKT